MFPISSQTKPRNELGTWSGMDGYRFALAHGDDFVREELLRYLSVSAGTSGKAAEVVSLLPRLRLVPSDEAAVLRGLTEGLNAIQSAVNRQPPSAASGAANQ